MNLKKNICRNITATNPTKIQNKLEQLIASKSLGFFGKISLCKTSQNDKRNTSPQQIYTIHRIHSKGTIL